MFPLDTRERQDKVQSLTLSLGTEKHCANRREFALPNTIGA